ncbi:UDP-N-acetylglucosamine diphosphorylase/glucosamine-1-phosphate N-acetyltransferase [Candidatus Pantoea edessiphila]|uniref:Bifunctional protein GlmU n=1 Tax=Candidatus Pantoea edessiphila TaxID=2044610 RepID=A0A2P5SXA9_9GAMM|nr:bifunctional UDP-N-acetylglucosamine diphosphorylase/glucosamine-1-phosphate N-acetyltransferase GlmU [Candidatus Pantoea edessiphila]MBK4775845.1 UDP-N-acetylglucosamine diphosphorylase/glucosamine-1-phosphate N-acetyltransferase [Pantoea sp. Edef]PPI86966.1 UDP-N-acetylglucosamine diphosphorylase/glucosamine-1-phosphate N-acetyltransferase [Candidatus Pantoea edessiphila]
MYNNLINVVILAAGKGTRMCSDLPKVLHTLAGKPVIKYVVDIAKHINRNNIYIVYGFKGELLKSSFNDPSINWILQEEQLGTGHAIAQVLPYLNDNEDLLVLYGDIPLISKETIKRLCNIKPKNSIGLLTVVSDDPNGYGRIIRKNGIITEIIEHKDISSHQFTIREINTGIMIANVGKLKHWLRNINNNNAQKEYYLTDVIKIAYQDNCFIQSINPIDTDEIKGINNRLQLANLEKIYQNKQAEKLMLSGVTLLDPNRFNLRGTLICGIDVVIDIDVIFEENVVLGNRVKIGPGCIIKNSFIGDDCNIYPYSVINNSNLSIQCDVGPFSHFRNNVNLDKNACIGNFVEIKNVSLGSASKAKHLSYLGNSEIGSNVNIGAGTITCNYDGKNKLNTVIGNNVFIGACSQLIAPISIADNVTIAAGTTVLRDVKNANLVLNSKQQIHKKNWKRPSEK